jgi:hypothetical protein
MEDLDAIELLIILGAVAFLVYEFFSSDSVVSTALCSSVGVNCPGGAANQPTTGLGAVATWLGGLWGDADVAVSNASTTAANAVTQAPSTIGSYVANTVVPTPSAPAPSTPGLPAGYNPQTGTIDGSPSGVTGTW